MAAESSAADKIAHLAVNLFQGWGYNFYRKENLLRADDLMLRARVSELLIAAKMSVAAAEKTYRREFLPAPTREKPRPDAAALRDAQTLERLAASIGGLEGHIRALPVPEPDRMTAHLRREAETLSRLLEADQAMVGHAEFLRSLLVAAGAAWILEHAADLAAQIGAIEAAIQSRRDVLSLV
jgi:hypothetical protein